jgi:hypothetical protein
MKNKREVRPKSRAGLEGSRRPSLLENDGVNDSPRLDELKVRVRFAGEGGSHTVVNRAARS